MGSKRDMYMGSKVQREAPTKIKIDFFHFFKALK
jgi:hypothetical protein